MCGLEPMAKRNRTRQGPETRTVRVLLGQELLIGFQPFGLAPPPEGDAKDKQW